MVDKFKTIVEQITTEKGAMSLFAILKMDELTDRWTIILSAPWINDETFSYVRGILIQILAPEEIDTIARLGIFSKSEHIVEELLKYNEGTTINEDQKINGNIVHEAHIFVSNASL